MPELNEWFNEISELSGLTPPTFAKVVETMIIIFIVLATRFLAIRIVRRRIADVKRAYHAQRMINYAAGILLVLLIAREWITGLQHLGTFLGLLSAGIAIALADLLTSFAGWIFIMVRRPFEVGDRIEIGEHTGDVIDIRLFQTFMLECGNWVDADQSSGRIIMVPNNMIFKSTTASYTRGFEHIWDEIGVMVTFESDWKRAKAVVTEIANTHAEPLSAGAQQQIREAAREHMIFFNKLTPIVYTSVKDSGVMLSIRFLTHPRQRRGAEQRIWEAILDAFAVEPNIDLAYPTIRHYANEREGKPAMRAEPRPSPDAGPRAAD